MIVFQFNLEKTTQIANYLLSLNSNSMNYMKLIKLLYLIERESFKRFDMPISGDDYYSLPHGPILSRVYNLITEETSPEEFSYWHKNISLSHRYIVSSIENPDISIFASNEIDIVRHVHDQFGHMDQWQLRDYCHNKKNIPEYQDPNGSSIPIYTESILRALGKSDELISKIANRMDLTKLKSEAKYLSELDYNKLISEIETPPKYNPNLLRAFSE